MSARVWTCPKCHAEGPGLFALFKVTHRDPVDPARDEIACKLCGWTGTRYQPRPDLDEGPKP